MATKVHFITKAGKAESLTFPNRTLAEGYARTLKGKTRLEDLGEDQPVEIQRCPEGTAQLQKRATRVFHDPKEAFFEQKERAEHRAERMAEHFFEAQIAGQAPEDTWADWDYLNGRG